MELELPKILDLSNANSYYIDLNDEKEEKTALIIAIDYNFDEICKLLLSNERIDINCLSIFKRKSKEYSNGEVTDNNLNHFYMPLHLAVTRKRMNVIHLLLDHKDINLHPFQILLDNEIISKVFISTH